METLPSQHPGKPKYGYLRIIFRESDGSWNFAAPGVGTPEYAKEVLQEYRQRGREAYLVDLNTVMEHLPGFVLSVFEAEYGYVTAKNPVGSRRDAKNPNDDY